MAGVFSIGGTAEEQSTFVGIHFLDFADYTCEGMMAHWFLEWRSVAPLPEGTLLFFVYAYKEWAAIVDFYFGDL